MLRRSKKKIQRLAKVTGSGAASYDQLVGDLATLLDLARRTSARAVNALMTATYWEMGRRIVVFEQGGKQRAEYGEELLQRLGRDLTGRFGRGFSAPSLYKFRQFHLAYPTNQILSTVSIESDCWGRVSLG